MFEEDLKKMQEDANCSSIMHRQFSGSRFFGGAEGLADGGWQNKQNASKMQQNGPNICFIFRDRLEFGARTIDHDYF